MRHALRIRTDCDSAFCRFLFFFFVKSGGLPAANVSIISLGEKSRCEFAISLMIWHQCVAIDLHLVMGMDVEAYLFICHLNMMWEKFGMNGIL